ncbi:MAG: tetratricopeptide repeat protein [Deltaproteobacteria bacterium]|nr:tetratricopeptide repeat protein [Deltaproteobacteria bacterium]
MARRRSLSWLALAVLGSVLCAASPATADEPSTDATAPIAGEAARTILRGTALFDRGHYDGALAQFSSAYEQMVDHPRRHQVLYNIALCHERSFRYDRAIAFYERYLREGGTREPQAAEVRSILEALDGLLGTLRLVTNVASFEVWIDGHHVADSTRVVRLPAGPHVVEVRADGHLAARRETRVLVGRESRVQLRLERIDAYRGLPTPIFWVSGGVTAATLVGAVVVGLWSMADTRELELRLADPTKAWDVTEEEVQSLQTLSLAADVLYAVGGVLAISTLVLGLLTDWSGEPDVAPSGLAARPNGFVAWF